MVTSSNSTGERATDTSQITAPQVDPVAGKTIAEILGEIVWLMTQDPAGRKMKVADIEAAVMPAILQKRFHIKYAQVPDMRKAGTVVLQPVSAIIFAENGLFTGSERAPAILASFSVQFNARQ